MYRYRLAMPSARGGGPFYERMRRSTEEALAIAEASAGAGRRRLSELAAKKRVPNCAGSKRGSGVPVVPVTPDFDPPPGDSAA
jgi:hypothetical protein